MTGTQMFVLIIAVLFLVGAFNMYLNYIAYQRQMDLISIKNDIKVQQGEYALKQMRMENEYLEVIADRLNAISKQIDDLNSTKKDGGSYAERQCGGSKLISG